jgi:exosortase A
MKIGTDPGVNAEIRGETAPHESAREARAVPVALALLAICWILLWFWDTSASIVAIWYRSETFAHGFLIVPIVFYLVWYNRRHLGEVPIQPFLPGAALLALAGSGWLVAQLASVLGGAQFMMVAMIPLAILTMLGTRMVRALAFPLAFLFFAVPFGEFLLPTLMDWTADFAVAALRLSTIPVYREGRNFVIPSGSWSVVEACSGIRYLSASMVVGALYAYLTYRSLRYRLIFIAASIVVPLIANGLRAYMIVMIGHLSGNRLAVGVDHIIYGWVFFGVVMALLFWVGSFWREDIKPPAEAKKRTDHEWKPASTPQLVMAVLLVVVISSIWKPVLSAIDARNSSTSVRIPPVVPENGWVASEGTVARWKPDFSNPGAELAQTFTKNGEHVGLYIAFYRNQKQDGELVNSMNQLVRTTNKDWVMTASGSMESDVGRQRISIRTAEMRSAREQIVAADWYWVDGRITSSDYAAKAYLGLAKLSGHGDDSALIAVFTPKPESGESGNEVLGRFAADMGESIHRALAEADRQ